MKNISLTSLSFEDDDLKSYINEEVLIIEIKTNAFEIVTDLSESAYLFELLELAEKSPEAKAIFIYNEPGAFGDEEYDIFLHKVFKADPAKSDNAFGQLKDQTARIRQINILNHFISNAFNFKKILIMGLQGSIVTPFFGASLAADLLFATEDMRFSLAHLKYGLHPTGALPYLLPKYIGANKAKYYLYKGGHISSNEALSLGLINKVYSSDSFLNNCLSEIKSIITNDVEVLKITKKLININTDEIIKYFEFESKNTVLR